MVILDLKSGFNPTWVWRLLFIGFPMESQENVSFSIIYDDLYIVIKYLKRYIKSIITL